MVLEAMAARYGRRPSEMLGLAGWEAYCLDEALFWRHMKEATDQAGELRSQRGIRA
jgi:hypothetical protein